MTPIPSPGAPIPQTNILETFASVARPIGLAGLALGVLYLILRLLIRSNTFPKLTAAAAAQFGRHIVNWLFTLAIIFAVLGFAGYIVDKLHPPIVEPDVFWQGDVIDAGTNLPIEEARMLFPDHSDIAPLITDSDGAFHLQIAPRVLTARCRASHPSYQTKTLWVHLRPGYMPSQRFKLPALAVAAVMTPTATSAPALLPSRTPVPALLPSPTPVATSVAQTSAVKFHYRKLHGSEWFDGFFQRRAGSVEWREFNTRNEDEFRFREVRGEGDFFTLYDASREFYVRIPKSGGRVEGSIALSGPWGQFLAVERVAY